MSIEFSEFKQIQSISQNDVKLRKMPFFMRTPRMQPKVDLEPILICCLPTKSEESMKLKCDKKQTYI